MALGKISRMIAVQWIPSRNQVLSHSARCISCTAVKNSEYQVVVVGGGAGGCAVAAKFTRQLGKGKVAVVEPKKMHSYQPMWTLVGAGLKTFDQSQRPMADVLPENCHWVKDSAVKFDPDNSKIVITSGEEIRYQYLVVAAGIQLNYDKIPGLRDALENDPQVCSNYSSVYVNKTFPALQDINEGNAIFTFPNTPIKCAGAPQKIMYLAEEIFRNMDKRRHIDVIFNTSLPVIFGVKKYADALSDVIQNRFIKVNFRYNLQEVCSEKNEAVFELLDKPGETKTFKYSFLHVTPPMSAPDVLRKSPLVNEAGWVDVNKWSLQHNKYPNVFALGDCTSLPTSKTAAAAASQCGVLHKNMAAVMAGTDLEMTYDGYTSCPLITGKNKCILAEFDYDAKPLETFPFDQGIERQAMYHLKADVLPHLYWHFMLRGLWGGPAMVRNFLHAGRNIK